jgi:transcriptional regulator with XRE-family HTH domain
MGRRSGFTHNEARLRAHLAIKLKAAIGSDRGAISRVAQDLGITKQALSLYLREKATPSAETLRILCAGLKLQLEIEGAIVSASDPIPHRTEPAPQLTLFEAISSVDSKHLTVDLLKRGDQSMELKISIDFANQPGHNRPK